MMMPPPPSYADCVQVDVSQCDEHYGDGGGTPPPSTDIGSTGSVKVQEAQEMAPVQGARMEVVATDPRNNSTRSLDSGVTGSDGVYSFSVNVPTYQVLVPAAGYQTRVWQVKVIVRPAIGATSFPALSVSTGNHPANRARVFVAVCPGAMPAITCDIARAQALWLTIYANQMVAWNNSGFASEQANNVLRETFAPNDGRLQRHWVTTYSWWVGDTAIPPRDWDNLVDWHQQTAAIFNSIPFPRWAGIEDLFTRCAVGVPLTQARDGKNLAYGNARLYSETFSTYFPRSSTQIAKDMAASYSTGLASVLNCMDHRMRQKIKEVEGSLKAMSMINLAVLMYFGPMLMATGAGGFTVIATELYEFTRIQGGDTGVDDSYGVTAALAAAAIAANNTEVLMMALQPILDGITADMDPIAARAVNFAAPKILETAMGSASEYFGTEATAQAAGETGAASGASLGAQVGSAALVLAIKVILSIAKSYAAEEVTDYQEASIGANNAANDVLRYFNGEEAGPEFRGFLRWVVVTLDFEGMVNEAIQQFLEEYYEVWEQANGQGGTITLVPEEDGTLTLVATDGEGNPTDDDGVALPDGIAPTTPLEDYEPKQASPVAGLVGAGAATVLLLTVGGVL